MSLDVERNFISSILYHKDLHPALDARITADFFGDEQHREAWTWILSYYAKYAAPPTAKALRREFPGYQLLKVEEPIDYYLDELREQRRLALLQEGIIEAADLIDNDQSSEALNRLQVMITKSNMEVSVLKDRNLVETWEERIKEYRQRMDNDHKMLGIPTGFHTLDYHLLGMQPEQLWTVIGLPKAGKSTFLLRTAVNAHESGSSPLFIGFEMSNEEQESRYDAMIARISHHKLLSGRLTEEEFERVEQSLSRRKSMHPFHLSHDTFSVLTLSGVAGKIEQYRPDLLFIDGTYMMEDENGEAKGSSQALTNITRGAKRLAQRFRIPIIITTQALQSRTSKAQGLTTASIGYSSSFAQDSDVIIGAESTDADDDIKKLKIVAARNAPLKEFLVQWDWDSGDFSEHEIDEEGATRPVSRAVASSGYADDDDDDAEEEPRRRRKRRPSNV